MSMPSQVVRQARVRQKMRTDLWPKAPQLPESMIRRFPELEKYNQDMDEFVKKLRNATEADPEALTSSDPCNPTT